MRSFSHHRIEWKSKTVKCPSHDWPESTTWSGEFLRCLLVAHLKAVGCPSELRQLCGQDWGCISVCIRQYSVKDTKKRFLIITTLVGMEIFHLSFNIRKAF